jgi:hypothetical protein
MLSRLEGGASVADILNVSTADRLETLRMLVALVQEGIVRRRVVARSGE